MKKIAKRNLKLDKEVIASLSENEMSRIAGGDGSIIMTDKPNCTETRNEDCVVPPHTEEKFCQIYTTDLPVEHVTKEEGCQIIFSQSCPNTIEGKCGGGILPSFNCTIDCTV